MKTYRAAIFDLDGTLLNTIADIGHSANLVLTKYGHPTYDLASYKKFVGRGFLNLLHRAFPADTPEELFPELLECMLQTYRQHFMDQTTPYPGMVDLVNSLHAAGIPVAVNSNKRDQYTKALIAKHFPGIPFVDVIGEGADFPRKPKPDGAWHIAELMGLAPEQILYIGDSDTDMQTGHNAGMDTVGCAWGFRGEQELRDNGATYIAHTAEDIRKLF